MAGIITDKFRLKNAAAFIQNSATDRDSYYAFIGQPLEWAGGPGAIPDKGSTEDNGLTEGLIWDQIMSLKRLTPANMMHACKKILWENGTYYDMYRHDYDGVVSGKSENGATTNPARLSEARYYVTHNDTAYICISNNGGSASTVNPSILTYNTNTYTERANDGYVWKKISIVSALDSTHYETADFLPVKTIVGELINGQDYFDQYKMQQAAKTKRAGVYHIVIVNGGSGYGTNLSGTSASGNGIVTLTGNGDGFVGYVKTNASGAIIEVIVDDPGTGYDYANVVFTSGVGGAGAVGYAILTPANGLGADPVRDLCAHNVVVNMLFSSADTEFTTSNEYRRVGIVVNPLQYGNNNLVAVDNLLTNMTTLHLSGAPNANFAPDQIIKQNNAGSLAYGVIVDVTNATPVSRTNSLRIIRTRSENTGDSGKHEFIAGDIDNYPSNGTATGTVTSVSTPTVKYNSGSIIYYENRRAITRSESQEEEIKVVFEF